jgi:hypothetical protein
MEDSYVDNNSRISKLPKLRQTDRIRNGFMPQLWG